MKLPLYQVDAFSGRLFGGNPAAVCPLDQWPSDALMQAVAAENNLSETAFFVNTGRDFEIRWFTPVAEVDLCGHATLATAKVILDELEYPDDHLRFHSKSGLLKVHRKGHLLELDFPALPAQPAEAPQALIDALGLAPAQVLRSRHDYLLVYQHEAEVASLAPHFALLKQVEARGIIATAPGTHSDFVSRFFAPQVGVDEDPVTGSAHSVLTPYWAERLHKHKLHAFQISKRKGELFCELHHDRVRMAGEAVVYLKGEISVPD